MSSILKPVINENNVRKIEMFRRVPHEEQDLLTLPGHLRFWWGSCSSIFSSLCCFLFTFICLFHFFISRHGVVRLFSINEFDCPSGIFRPSFLALPIVLRYVKTVRRLFKEVFALKWLIFFFFQLAYYLVKTIIDREKLW